MMDRLDEWEDEKETGGETVRQLPAHWKTCTDAQCRQEKKKKLEEIPEVLKKIKLR
jgi:hypothetical protein